jgi:hypothetical protein
MRTSRLLAALVVLLTSTRFGFGLMTEIIGPVKDRSYLTVDYPGRPAGMVKILQHDGSPAVLDPPPWPGGEIMITFPYADRITVDGEGYFRVFFTPEQFKELKARRVEKNIYLPDFASKGSSTALYAFPAAKLSLDKAAAGEVRIASPRAKKK